MLFNSVNLVFTFTISCEKASDGRAEAEEDEGEEEARRAEKAAWSFRAMGTSDSKSSGSEAMGSAVLSVIRHHTYERNVLNY